MILSRWTSKTAICACWNIQTQQQMDRPVNEVVNEGSSIQHAALLCGVLKSSLGDHVGGRVVVDATISPSTYLSPKDDDSLREDLLHEKGSM